MSHEASESHDLPPSEAAAPTDTPPPSQKPGWETLLSGVTALGALLYATGWWFLHWYYGQLGITPEEVGVDFSWLVMRVVAVLIGLLATAGFIGGLVWLTWRSLRDLRAERKVSSAIGVVVWGLFAALFALFIAMSGYELFHEGPRRLRQNSATPLEILLTEQRVRVEPIEGSVLEDISGECMWYLGGSENTMVLYRYSDGVDEVYRVPDSTVVLASDPDCGELPVMAEE